MIVEDRTGFWDEIAAHPEVKPHLGAGEGDLSAFVQLPVVTPLRSQNGGFLFARLDSFGRVYELHTLYRPEGWGREVLEAAKEAFAQMFARGAQAVVTYEAADWWRSRPPKSFGFRPAGDFAPAGDLSLRTWILTADAWAQSPAFRRM